MKKIAIVLSICGASSAIVGGAAWAHHSYQMFDTSREITLTGTLKSVEWTNPHIWFQVMVDVNGTPVEYGFEGGGVSVYSRAGWHRPNIPLGDKVVVVNNPMRSGEPGGNLVKMTFSNGAVLGRDGTAPNGKPVPSAPASKPE